MPSACVYYPMKIKAQSILFTSVAAMLLVGCGHHKHHRDHESLTGKVVKYPFRMTRYAIGAPFHPFKSTRNAFNATVDIPEKAVSSTSDALFGHRHDHNGDRHHDDRDHDHDRDRHHDDRNHDHNGDRHHDDRDHDHDRDRHHDDRDHDHDGDRHHDDRDHDHDGDRHHDDQDRDDDKKSRPKR